MKRFFLLKKILLILLGVLALVEVKASDLSGIVDGVTGNTGQNPKVQTLNVSVPGALEQWVAAITTGSYADGGNNPFNGFGGSGDFEKLEITGTLNAADFAALSSVSCAGFSRFPAIDMSGVTLADDATVDDVLAIDFRPASFTQNGTTKSGSGAQYIRLPNGVTDVAKVGQLKDGGKNSNLKVAGAYDGTAASVDKTHFAAYSFVKGNIKTFSEKLFTSQIGTTANAYEMTGDPHSDDLRKLTLGGEIAMTDISEGGSTCLFKSTALNEMDLYECTFEECTFTVGQANGNDYTHPTPAGTTITSNALYYLKNYSGQLVTCVLPKGNTEIPPLTFANSSGTGPIRNITIPEGYTKIGFEAFYGHDLLTLDLPGSLQEVGAGAFRDLYGNSQLTDVTMHPLDGSCVFGEAAFMRNFVLKHVTLSEGVTAISDHMFDQCYLLESVRIPSTCESIGTMAFWECFDLHSITIPEGVQYIYQSAFENTGLTDIYVMATTPAALPKIYAMSPTGVGPSSFSYQRTTGNNTVPTGHLEDLGENTQNGGWNSTYDDVITWYQAEMSGENGLGTGNALVALHYPDEMKGFFEGIDVTDFYTPEELAGICGWQDSGRDGSSGWLDYVTGQINGGDAKRVITQKIKGTYGSSNYNGDHNATGADVLQYLPQTYSVNGFEHEGQARRMGPDANDMYYPNQADYVMRMAAGATDATAGQCMSQWGWRQFPLAYALGDINKEPFDKLYDDTWYTMCFPWHMTDEQLFEAFNQDMEITEFVGVEMIEQGDPETNAANQDWNYELVFHFDDVAVTTYRDNEDIQYDRVKVGHRDINGEDRNIYRYTSKDGNNTVVEYPLEYKDKDDDHLVNQGVTVPNKNDMSAEAQALREAYGNYLSIQNILSLAGRPYMIHPAIGARPGNPATVYINAELKTESPWTTAEQAVEKTATIDDQLMVDGQNKGGQTAFVNPLKGGGGKYTFIGNVGKVNDTDTDVEETTGNRVMPTPAYFLAVEKTGETEEVPIYENQSVPVVDGLGNPVMIYLYVGEGNGSYDYIAAHYVYVGEGQGNYVPTAFTQVDGTGSYDYNLAAFTYQQGGNYVPASYSVNASGTGTFDKIEEHYEAVGNNQGNYKATAWEHVTDNSGQYDGNVPVTYYSYPGQNYVVSSAVETVGGAYDAVLTFGYVGTGGNYDPSGFVDGGYQIDCHYSLENGEYVYSTDGYKQYKPSGYTAVAEGTGSYNEVISHYNYVGEGNGHYSVEFSYTDYDPNGYTIHECDLTYRGTTGHPYKATAWEQVGNNQGEWVFRPTEYVYNSNGTGNCDPATFEQVTSGSGNYVLAAGAQEYVYNASGNGNYEPSAWTDAEGSGTHNYVEEEYVATEGGEYDYVQKTEIKPVQVGTEIVPVYAKYPKFFRKKTTSGYKWSKYSAIIQPDADAIANIEAFLDFSAAANGFNVAIGEWEVVTPTAIEEILNEAERNSQPVQRIHLNVVYNVKGQVVRTGDTSLEGLPKGLYIVNGKKYMVK